MDKYHQQVDDLRKLENGTLGKEIVRCLDKHKLTLVPKYESHDLKHVLLEYKNVGKLKGSLTDLEEYLNQKGLIILDFDFEALKTLLTLSFHHQDPYKMYKSNR